MQRTTTILLAFIFSLQFSLAADDHGSGHGHEEAKDFNPGKMIVDHVIDAHDWHVLSIGETHVSVPLPIILYHNGKLVTFSSSKFHHGHDSYKGYRLMLEGENKGKIVYEETGELPLDLSITKNVTSMLISMVLICIIFITVAKGYTKRKGKAPKGIQSFLEPLILFIRDDVAKASIGEKNYEKYLPFLLTLFFFIFFNNLFGLVPFFPGGANLTGNIAVTGVMAIFTFIITTFSGNKNYWVHIFNTPGVPWWLKIPVPLMPIVELMGVFTKPFVLMVRLFANITAGHIIVLGFMSLIFIFGSMLPAIGYGVSLVSVAFSVFMLLLELLVAFIQAYVFTLLSAMYFGMATEEHH
jgi:F-type H+-transporting ATPase subunit a